MKATLIVLDTTGEKESIELNHFLDAQKELEARGIKLTPTQFFILGSEKHVSTNTHSITLSLKSKRAA